LTTVAGIFLVIYQFLNSPTDYKQDLKRIWLKIMLNVISILLNSNFVYYVESVVWILSLDA